MRRRYRRKQRKIIIVSFISLLLVMSVGYAAFNTNLNISAKGNTRDYNAAWQLKKKVVTSGDGLYKDIYEEDRYIYKGDNPDNYITFNNELWRIFSVEGDETLKIIRTNILKSDSFSVDWKTATINQYLNDTYYNDNTKISDEAKSQMTKGIFNIGPADLLSTDLLTIISSEKSVQWEGNIALVTLSEYTRASANSECSLASAYYNNEKCYNNIMNWLQTLLTGNKTKRAWMLTPCFSSSSCAGNVHVVSEYDRIYTNNATSFSYNFVPMLFVKNDIKLTGTGTETDPYIIKT